MTTPRPQRLVSLGSVIVDWVLDVPALPDRGGDVLAHQVTLEPGGGMNLLVAARRLGLPTAYAGAHGTGVFADRVRTTLAAEGVQLVGPRTPQLDTGTCITLVDPEGERTFVTVVGADAELAADALADVTLGSDDALYVSGYDVAYDTSGPVLARLVPTIPRRPLGPLVVLDPGPLLADVPDDRWAAILPRVDLLTLNDREAAHLDRLRRWLRPDAVVVHRVGARGALLLLPGETSQLVPAPQVDAVDATGAGDTHTGALLAALRLGRSWLDAVAAGNHAAAHSVTVRGGASGPTPDQLRARWPAGPW